MTGVDAASEESAAARLGALERVLTALARLAEAGPVSALIERAPGEVARALEFDRALLSRVADGTLVAEAIHCGGQAGDAAALLEAMRRDPVRLTYPLAEAEVLRRRRAQLIAGATAPARHAFGTAMDWDEYLVAPIVLAGQVIGLLQCDRCVSQLSLCSVEREAVERFAEGFAGIFERAVLRRRLRAQRQELRQVASWADARTGELSDSAIDLAVERDAGEGDEPAPARSGDSPLRDLVTKRELDVLEHMVQGETNAKIARALVVSEETVKFHVKNILRKLDASNRAEASIRYLRILTREHGSQGTGARTRWPASNSPEGSAR